MGIDRTGAYKAAVERRLAHADSLYDNFHNVADYNEVIGRVRRRPLAEANALELKFARASATSFSVTPINSTRTCARVSLACLPPTHKMTCSDAQRFPASNLEQLLRSMRLTHLGQLGRPCHGSRRAGN